MADPKPLWEVMQSAYLAGRKPGFTDCHGYAAELRALADEVVPEEPEPPSTDHHPWPGAYQLMSDSRWEQRMATRALLLKAAAEAEGEP